MKIFQILLVGLISTQLWAAPDEIIGKDERRQIHHISEPFYATVGQLENPHGYCTATLIGPRHILTNGHCVVIDDGKLPMQLYRARDIRFVPGRTGLNAPYGVFHGRRIHTFPQWIRKGSPQHDVALVVLDRDVNLETIQLEELRDKSVLRNSALYVAGYSIDTPFGSMWEGRGRFVMSSRRDQLIYHTADTLPGTSGALIRRRAGQGWIGIGVHAGANRYFFVPVNRGVLFNATVTNTLRNWLR